MITDVEIGHKNGTLSMEFSFVIRVIFPETRNCFLSYIFEERSLESERRKALVSSDVAAEMCDDLQIQRVGSVKAILGKKPGQLHSFYSVLNLPGFSLLYFNCIFLDQCHYQLIISQNKCLKGKHFDPKVISTFCSHSTGPRLVMI